MEDLKKELAVERAEEVKKQRKEDAAVRAWYLADVNQVSQAEDDTPDGPPDPDGQKS